MDQIQPYLDYFAQHPSWALIIVFLISMGEALLVIGLFVPSTAVLVGAGTLVGAGKLDFWPVMAATTLGCIVGDQLSFWAGRFFGDRLKTMWPLKNYPQLLAKGEAYVKQHGGKSIAIGRFVPGVKAVVPGIAGMLGMGEAFFLMVNITSGIFWSLMHLLPGVLLGHALSLAGELSGRLLVVLLVLLAILAVAGWLVRLLAQSLTPYRKAVQRKIAGWAGESRFRSVRRFGRVMAPDNPNSVLLLLFIILGLAAIVGLIDLVSGLLIRHAVGDFDFALFNFFSELRSVPGDEIFVRVTMLGDEYVLYAVALVPILWMAFRRNWRAAAAMLAAVVAAKIVTLAFSFGTPAPGLGSLRSDFRFPSPHVLMAGTVFGTLAVITSRGLQRWTQALIAACLAMLVIAIAFSRLYLGVNWLSDILGGILIASIIVVLFSVAVTTISFGRFRPLALLAVSVATLLIATGIDSDRGFERRLERYQPVNKIATYSIEDYMAKGWTNVPGQRINLAGRPSDIFVLHWIGPVAALQDIIAGENYTVWNRWGWKDALPYLSPDSQLDALAPNPAVHEGLRAKMTASVPDPTVPNTRNVLRAFQSNTVVTDTTGNYRVYLVGITHESVKRSVGLFAVPSDRAAAPADVQAMIDKLKADPRVETVGSLSVGGQVVTILRPKS
ncbi:VTT domain-containing protein [Aestuariivirga litoralis]|uniref:VTT domain-containing protein n=1 Tax=Aestuariivirga litoralis TaxID=2650924 RepID=UPI0018C57E7D|nr:VTT domain-containing protein [Aestuariivirga litoralis]MBG1231917.1 phosphatase PAP2 family protein [Aestuariivirga litoralis]